MNEVTVGPVRKDLERTVSVKKDIFCGMILSEFNWFAGRCNQP
jgi:hypothetical protein